MSHPKVERARELISAIDRTRNALAAMEQEFEELVVPKRRRRKAVAEKPSKVVKSSKTSNGHAEAKKPSRSKVKIVRMLKKSGSLSFGEIESKLGISHSGVSSALKALMDSNEIVRPSYGHYELKS